MVDHSLTYRVTIRNVTHVMRKREILRHIKGITCCSYADFGCSNGYLTDIIGTAVGAERTVGYDRRDENLADGSSKYPHVEFRKFDLNVKQDVERFDFVTCLETLEHVGNLEIAVDNILRAGRLVLISVPIEIGVIGILKFVAKVAIGYPNRTTVSLGRYFKGLLAGDRISRYRAAAESYGSHFGFDYRDLDDLIGPGKNRFTTRFYLITSPV